MSEVCDDCGRSFPSAPALRAHVSEEHARGSSGTVLPPGPRSPDPGLVCALCGERFPTREALADHNFRPHYRTNRSHRKSWTA